MPKKKKQRIESESGSSSSNEDSSGSGGLARTQDEKKAIKNTKEVQKKAANTLGNKRTTKEKDFVLVSLGGKQSQRVHKMKAVTTIETCNGKKEVSAISTPDKRNKQKVNTGIEYAIFKASKIIDPHSYKDQRATQILRWISTTTYIYAIIENQVPIEIQCGYYSDPTKAINTKAFYVSSNLDKCNKWLEKVTEGCTAKDFMEKLIAIEIEKFPTSVSTAVKKRFERHQQHLTALLKDELKKEFGSAIDLGTKVMLPMSIDDLNKRDARDGKTKLLYTDGLHAERRIGISARINNYTTAIIAGLKRPCAVCWQSFKTGEIGASADHVKHINCGPAWPSQQSVIGYSVKDIEALIEAIPETCVTRIKVVRTAANQVPEESQIEVDKVLELTTDFGSDSESDPESKQNTWRASPIPQAKTSQREASGVSNDRKRTASPPKNPSQTGKKIKRS